MNRTNLVTIIVILSVVALAGWYTFTVVQKDTAAQQGNSPAAIALKTDGVESSYTDIAGNPIALDDYLGSVLVVNSWASWCPFCVQELPDFDRLGNEYRERGVMVLAINRAEPGTTASAFLQSVSVGDGLQLVLDPTDRYYQSIAGFTMPETVFYDPEGNVVMHKRGFMVYEEMQRHTEAALAASTE